MQAQIDFSQFPKIGFDDMWTLKRYSKYYGGDSSKISYSAQSYFYPDLWNGGFTHIVTTGDFGAPFSSYNQNLKIIDHNFDKVNDLAVISVRSSGNLIDIQNGLSYEVGGNEAPLTSSGDNVGFGNITSTATWIAHYNSGTIGDKNFNDNTVIPNVRVYAAQVSTHSAGILLKAKFPYYHQPHHRVVNDNWKIYIKARIDGLNNNTNVAVVTIYDTETTPVYDSQKNYSDNISEPVHNNQPPLNTIWTIKANEFSGSSYTILSSSFFKKRVTNDKQETPLYIEINWAGTRNLYIDQIAVASEDFGNMFITPISNFESTVQSQLRSTSRFGNVYTNSKFTHLYFDEPEPLMYRGMKKVSDVVATSNGLGVGKYINGAANGITFSKMQAANFQRRPPYITYNYYPINEDFTTSSSGTNNIQGAFDKLIEHSQSEEVGSSPAGLKQAILWAQNFTSGNSDDIPLVNTIQVQGEKYIQNGAATSDKLYRPPTPNEIKCMGYLSLCYGAKGLMYYLIHTDTPHPVNSSKVRAFYGLFDESGKQADYTKWNQATPTPNFWVQDPAKTQVPNSRFTAVNDLNHAIENIESELLQLTWQNAYSIHQGQPGSSNWVSDVRTTLSETQYIELGIFKRTSDNTDYFMVVNRRTLSSESRNITVTFNLSSYDTWKVIEIGTDNSWIVSKTGNFQTTYEPGEGKLFKFVPMFVGSSETISGNVTVSQSLTIASGKTLNIQGGTNLNFAYNKYININGTLSAIGTQQNGILFSLAGTTSYVRVLSGGSTFKYCTFENGYYGLYLDAISSGSPTIVENCTFRDNTYAGIRFRNSNLAKVKSCQMYDNNYYGVSIYNSDVNFTGNQIYSNGYDGIYSSSGSLLQLYGNVIENNGRYGLYTAYADAIYIGKIYLWWGYNTISENGNNEVYATNGNSHVEICGASIHDDSNLEVYNYSGNQTIYAQSVYWDANCAQVSSNVVPMATIYCSLPTTPPDNWEGQPRTAGSPIGKAATIPLAGEVEWFLDPNIPDEEKIRIGKDIIAANPESAEGKEALSWVYSIIRRDYAENSLREKDNFFDYLMSTKNRYSTSEISTLANKYMIVCKMLGRDNSAVIELCKETLNQLTGEDRKLVLADLAFAYIHSNQIEEAKNILQELQAKYKDVEEIIAVIEWDIEDVENQIANGYFKPDKALVSEISVPEKFELFSNYPNPFNPSTTITYALPYQSSVEVVIYDITGRVIKSFNLPSQSAGYQNVIWDGRNENGEEVSSGVYLYRISIKSLETNETFMKTAKLIMLK